MMYKFQHYPCNESAEQIYHCLAEVQHECQWLSIGLWCTVYAKHLYNSVMPRAGSVGCGYQDGYAAGGKAGQTCYWANLCCRR